ncbi:hypothetical protein BK132_03840 [Paenibacillus sp. FSL H8-0259]|nr:hypothetical protein BK132_03840 [Paenibacillus sp. FSL H8-0259]
MFRTASERGNPRLQFPPVPAFDLPLCSCGYEFLGCPFTDIITQDSKNRRFMAVISMLTKDSILQCRCSAAAFA